jgi:DNA-binding NarL/FixJ family response regulator
MEPMLHSAVVVRQHPNVRQPMEIIPDAESCDVVLIESPAHAYSLIKSVAPELVIVCLEMNDRQSFHVLSMLTLDSNTRKIRVVIKMTQREAEESSDSLWEHDERVSMQMLDLPIN